LTASADSAAGMGPRRNSWSTPGAR
jgi:hypothetical protein